VGDKTLLFLVGVFNLLVSVCLAVALLGGDSHWLLKMWFAACLVAGLVNVYMATSTWRDK
jgi:hypothetical protein